MINVSHQDAELFCDWLSSVTNAVYRLPTEAEWEYACRARFRSAYTFGEEISKEQANFGLGLGKTSEVGVYPANDWNLHDMHGNLREWCADTLRSYAKDTLTDPMDDGRYCACLARRFWDDIAHQLRSACRYAYPQDFRDDGIGFRCAGFGGRQARYRLGGQGFERSRSPDSPTGHGHNPNA